MSTPPSKEGGAGGLALRAECEGVISEKVWALLGEERRRMVMDTLHRTEADNVPTARALTDGGYLRLRNPARGISATSCLIEIDIRIKAKHAKLDTVIIDGSVVAVGDFDPWRVHHVDWLDGRVTFESSVVERGVEATIQLDFLEVPQGGFHVPMRDECRRDCDGFIASPGKYDQKFIMAVSYPDTLHIEFMEERGALSFVATKHGNKQHLYRFNNGALVSVQVYWSTIGDVDDSDTD
ncbi:hypothetical protein ZWY2020_040095 [Hordeum vulgare]|nr:hypothetical protein ZWY2020_040095 [Hordeum vulgare]